jgi:hypothetical protein
MGTSDRPGNLPGPSKPAPFALRHGPTAEHIAELCRAANQYVERAVGMSLPGGEDSLAFVDHYLGVVRESGAISDELLSLVSAALGAYLGEVAIAGDAGEGEAGDAGDPATWRVELLCAPLTFDPVGMAAEALRLGPVEGHFAGLTTVPDYSAALVDALGKNPVSEEYYYSLTGRLETLGYAVELLMEFQRQKQERKEQGLPEPADADEENDDGRMMN